MHLLPNPVTYVHLIETCSIGMFCIHPTSSYIATQLKQLIFLFFVFREPTTGLVSEMAVDQQTQNLPNSIREGLYELLNGTTDDSV